MGCAPCSTHLQVAARLHPVDLVLRGLEVEQLHVDAVLSVLLDEDPGEVETERHAGEEVAEVVPGIEVAQHALTEGKPRTLPKDLLTLLDLLGRSVRHGDLRAVDLQGLREGVEHLLVIVESHLALDELVHVRLELRSVVTKLLEEGIVLRWQVVGVFDGGRELWGDVRRDAKLVAGHHVPLKLHLGVPARLVIGNGVHHRPTGVNSLVVPGRALVQKALLHRNRHGQPRSGRRYARHGQVPGDTREAAPRRPCEKAGHVAD
mmetsp:Transcript_103462/g.231079  ORF Transcript_103462/g.231079 Transcript_103462/m.231079 type:complete len:262 (-) Transcript_103462:58-843(-)